ncbi:MAG TPA: hypothetical protein VKQ28_05245 [Candidatus Acidoferrum sp.]|nr:hypothetical protein [Candidatus Acidoferrum sp.]
MAWDEATGIDAVDEQLLKAGVPRQVLASLAARLNPAAAARPNVPRFTGPRPGVQDVPAPAIQANAGQAPAGVPSFTAAQPKPPVQVGSFPTPAAPSFTQRFQDAVSSGQQQVDTAQQRVQQAQPSGLRKLGAILAGVGTGVLGGGRAGMAEAQQIWNQPKAEAQAELARTQATADQNVNAVKTEAGLQKQDDAGQFDTPEKRRAYLEAHPDEFAGADQFQKNDFVLAGKFPQREQAQKPEDVVHAYSDALASGNTAEAERLKPLVQQYMETTAKPQRDPAEKSTKEQLQAQIAAADAKGDKTAVKQLQARLKAIDPEGQQRIVIQQNRAAAPGATADDPKQIAAAIIRGEQPPDLKGLYRSNAPVRAELARQGFNLAKADEDWHATQKYLATLNGSQQTRLRQAVESTKGYLGQVEDIYNQWQQIGASVGWKTFNKGSLAVAKQLPGQAGDLAHRLEARIADLTSDLGTVYKGGNSSTDESLKLAAKNLSADWNEKTFRDAITDIRKSIQIRENSMKFTGPAGVSEGNAYTPPATNPPATNLPPGWK